MSLCSLQQAIDLKAVDKQTAAAGLGNCAVLAPFGIRLRLLQLQCSLAETSRGSALPHPLPLAPNPAAAASLAAAATGASCVLPLLHRPYQQQQIRHSNHSTLLRPFPKPHSSRLQTIASALKSRHARHTAFCRLCCCLFLLFCNIESLVPYFCHPLFLQQ